MLGPQRVDSTDPREPLVSQVFSELCQSALEQASGPAAERRLWHIPEVAAYYVFNVVTDEDKKRVDSIVHRLRLEAGEVINLRLDRSEAKRALADRLARARFELICRPWRAEDARRFAFLIESERFWERLPEEYPDPVTEELAASLIAISNGTPDRHYVNAVEWGGEPVGQVRLQFDSSPYPDSAEISYWIGESYWGQGLGTRLVTLFTAECFTRWRRIQRVFANVLDNNVASMRVLEKAGYRYESFEYQNVMKHGARRSTYVFGVCRSDYTFQAIRPERTLMPPPELLSVVVSTVFGVPL